MSHNDADPARLRAAVLQQLESWRRAGVRFLPRSEAGNVGPTDGPSAKAPSPAAQSAVAEPTTAESNEPAPSPDSPSARKQIATAPAAESAPHRDDQLAIIQAEVAGCRQCPELAESRTQTVFGVGNPQPRLCFLGEAPGADEDRQGEPFVGRAGQLLDKIITACGLAREEVYILNTLKCRPPDNRNPLPHEAANCRGFLDRQLAVLQPEFICCLGAVAAQNLLDTTSTIGELRGRFHDYRGIQVMATYHPAYLLRTPAAKKKTWDDMKMLLSEMGLPVPSK